MNLTSLKQGDIAYISKIIGKGSYRKRIMEMGFSPGTQVLVVRKAPFNDPVEYEIRGSRVALRNVDAIGIEVVTISDQPAFLHKQELTFENSDKSIPNFNKSILVALIGNPNSGKTTLYNSLTGERDRVANYSGVTVEESRKSFKFGEYKITIVDLSGIYSLNVFNDTDRSIRKFLRDEQPDVIVNILDAGNLERNLYLTTDLIDMDTRMVIAMNMMDELERKNKVLDTEKLGVLLGFPVVPIVAKDNTGVSDLMQKIVAVYEDQDVNTRHVHINYGDIVESSILKVQNEIKKRCSHELLRLHSSRFLSIKLIEKDLDSQQFISQFSQSNEIIEEVNHQIQDLEKEFGTDSEAIVTSNKQGFIVGALRETLQGNPALSREERTLFADRILIHRFWGIPIFILFLWLMFLVTFQLGKYPMDWIQLGVHTFSDYIAGLMSAGMLKDLLIDGILSGVGGVLIFLPNILILYFFIALMEGSGYMSRAVFILDKSMHKIGLHGKSFIPLVMGFGCNVPAIMSTRMLENRNERMVTMLINPFISCNARLPVYLLFTSAFFPNSSASILFIIYLFGVILAILTAILLRKTIFKTTEMPFVMELPPYRMPSVGSLSIYMWDKAKEYLKKIAGVILIASIIFWSLSYFPLHSPRMEKAKQEELAQKTVIDLTIAQSAPLVADSLIKAKENITLNSQMLQKSYQREDSYLGQFGKFIEPVLKPIGLDWKLGISLLSGLTAKEIIVSTLAVLYHADDASKDGTLAEKLKSQKIMDGDHKGEPVFTPLIAFVFMIFVSIYFPCIGTIIAISRESGSAKWGLFAVAYTMSLAWIISFIIFQGGKILGL